MTNAIHYTPAGGTITVRSEQDASAVRFTLSDTGPGIAPENCPTSSSDSIVLTPRAPAPPVAQALDCPSARP